MSTESLKEKSSSQVGTIFFNIKDRTYRDEANRSCHDVTEGDITVSATYICIFYINSLQATY